MDDGGVLDRAAIEIQDVAAAYLEKKKLESGQATEADRLRRAVHDIVFDAHSQSPEGVYLRLMHAIKK